jgi:hypothetical protein
MNWIWNGTLISQGALSEAPPAMADGYLIDTNVIWELRPAGGQCAPGWGCSR